MIEKIKEGTGLQYHKLTEEEKTNRKILGRLVGPIADCLNPTRNGRMYTEELWEKVFDNPIMKEKFKNKVLYGELGHPADRTEIDMEKIAVCMSEQPKKNSKGQLEAIFDILDTPNGRILKTLCDYGSTLGISSRGQGELVGDQVDPDTYECECWDIVLVPAVETARLKYVTESLSTTNKKSLKEALEAQYSNATADDQLIMKETLDNLDIKLECNSENCADKKDESEELKTKEEASNVGSNELVESLQDALKAKSELEEKIQLLQGELAVSNTKVDALNEELKSYKANTVRLTSLLSKAKEEAKQMTIMESELSDKNNKIKELSEKLENISRESKLNKQSLSEAVTAKDENVRKLTENLNALTEKLNSVQAAYENKIATLTEDFKKKEGILNSNIDELNQTLRESQKITESYKKTTTSVINSFIEEKAAMLGVKKEEIINRLPKKYSISDIKTVCEGLKKYNINMKKLPFNLEGSIEKVTITESSDVTLKTKNPLVDDEIDDMLLSLVSKK